MGLILGILGTSISFILLIIEKKEAKQRKIILSIAAVGFLTLLGQQSVQHISSKTSEQVIDDIKNKTELIVDVTGNIDSNVSAIQLVISEIANKSIEKLGVEISTIDDLENLHAFDKGNPDAWHTYKKWLGEKKGKKTALKIYLDSGRHYNSSLILIYLLTNKENNEKLSRLIRNYGLWSNFPRADELTHFNIQPDCDFVLFMNSSGDIAAFADTRAFINDLVMLFQTNQNTKFERLLSNDGSKFMNYTKTNLTSVFQSIHGNNPSDLANKMIEKETNESITAIGGTIRYFNLTSMISVVSG